jgi:hypothetical protein
MYKKCEHVHDVQVMNDKQNRQMLMFVGGFAVVLLLLYYLLVK